MDQKNYIKLELYPSHQEVNVPIDEVENIVPFTDFRHDMSFMSVHMKNGTNYTARHIEPSAQEQQMTPGDIITYEHRDYQTWNLVIFKDSPLERVVHMAPIEIMTPALSADNLNYVFLKDDNMGKSPETIARIIETAYYPTEYAQYSGMRFFNKEKTFGETYIFKGTKHERKITFYTISELYKWGCPFIPLHKHTNVFIIPDGFYSDYLIVTMLETQALKRYNIVLD